MGKPTGFLDYPRRLPQDRQPLERIKDWQEFHGRSTESDLRQQGARCMDCGVPFCHSSCPLGNLIPEWNDLIYRGLAHEAFRRLVKTNPFPEFTGRVCPALCEGSCTVGLNEPQVTAKNNEYALSEEAFVHGWVSPHPPIVRSGYKVAVVGSGPSGLASAEQLNKDGHRVTIFERADRIGGLLMYGIPNMKLDKEIVRRRIDILAAEGVEFILNTEVGKDYSVKKLQEQYDAVVLCGGAAKPRDLAVKGRDSNGVHYAVDFLKANTKSLLDSNLQDKNYIAAQGKDVIVIGGGDTGTDCVATAIRHGCRSVVQFEILPQPPVERQPDNPWPEWPRLYKVDYGQEEAAALYGTDPRHYCLATKEIISDDLGRAKEVRTVKVEWSKGENGRFRMTEVPGSEQTWPAELVLLALGFLGPEDGLLVQLGVERDSRSNVRASEDSFATNVPGVFAAGDMRRGQSLVVWAIYEGREAARAVHRYLMRKEESASA